MHKRIWFPIAFGAMLAASSAIARDEGRDARAVEGTSPGTIERTLTRLERAVARLEARLAGRGGSMMEGCSDMMAGGGMMGGGMMGGSRPNERWHSTSSR